MDTVEVFILKGLMFGEPSYNIYRLSDGHCLGYYRTESDAGSTVNGMKSNYRIVPVRMNGTNVVKEITNK